VVLHGHRHGARLLRQFRAEPEHQHPRRAAIHLHPGGLTTISGNTLIRDGDLDPNWQFGVGALWFGGSQGWGPGPINVSNALIEQSPYEAVQWVEGTISNVNLNNVTIAGTGTFALQEQTGGTASLTNVTATGVAQASAGNAPSYSCEGGNFVITDGGGSSGIAPTQCNGWPAPVFPPYPVTGVNTTPSALSFGSAATGTTAAAQTVTVTNPASAAASVSSISVSGGFSQTSTCGSSIAANGSCTVSVKFSPAATGARTGTLTVNAGGVTNTVSLSGTGTAPGPVLNAAPGSLSFAGTIVGSSAATQTVTVTNSGTTAATVTGVAVTGDFSQTSNCTSIAVGGSCTVTVKFTPTTAGSRTGTLTVTSNANNSPATVALTGSGIGSTTNIAAGRPASASSVNSPYAAANITDADPSTYWESANGSFPQWAQVDLGQSYRIGKITLRLPPSTAWGARTETLSVLGSTDGSNFSTIVGSAGYTFDPNANNNTVTVTFNATTVRYVRVNITANTGWAAGQLSDFAVFPSGTGTGTPVILSQNQPASASGYTQTYVPANAVDGNTSTYWESTDSAFPQWFQVDLGAAKSFSRLVLDLPPFSSWATRTQTLAIQGSTDGSTFTTIVASAGYTFDPSTGNTVTITFPAASYRYVRANFTANTGWPAGQLSEFQVWSS